MIKFPAMDRSTLVLLVLLFLTGTAYWFTRPFADVLASRTVLLGNMSVPQKMNVEMAARALDGTVIRPNETFSFNRVVGPRPASAAICPHHRMWSKTRRAP